MNTPQTQYQPNELITNMMKLHQCSGCTIRCKAKAKPHSIFARIHRWHMTWWPGWKIYQAELRTRNAKLTPDA